MTNIELVKGMVKHDRHQEDRHRQPAHVLCAPCRGSQGSTGRNEKAGAKKSQQWRLNRNGLVHEKAGRSQVIDFACDIKNRDTRGKPNQLYSRENALALLGLTTNFTGTWTEQAAIDALNQAFD